MSQENVEIVRQRLDAFQAGMASSDLGAWVDVADDFEWIVPTPFEGRSVWVGRDGFFEFVRTWAEQFEDWSLRVEQLIDAGGDRVVALAHQTATGKESGVPVDMNLGQVWELKGDHVLRVRNYFSHAEALEAAGLRE
jgi:ketosteroid isomerase-like protein